MERVALTLLDLHKENNPKANKRALNCRSYRVRYDRKNPDRYIFLVKCLENYSSSDGHLVSLLFQKDKNGLYPLNNDVSIKCSCPAWKYWGSDYQSTKQDYWLDTKEHRYPIYRDPRLENKICKHVARLRLDLRNVTFRTLDKKKKPILSNENELPIVSIDECMRAILKYFESRNLENGMKFFSSLNESNFEQQLLDTGIII